MTTVLDWRKHHLGVRAARCRYGRACLTADAHGKPAHKACAERRGRARRGAQVGEL